jgi:tRNA(His) 5'-end guanylyltransferase
VSKDPFGDRLKGYEAVETGRRLDPHLPVYARIDGRGFSRFTRGMRRPFDERMSFAMRETTRHLIREAGARLGYTQSDEISLIWHVPADVPGSQMFFDAKVQKLCSVLAGLATASFGRTVATFHDPEFAAYASRLPHFDARVFNLPSREEGANAFLWREFDATRNAVSMAAFHHFSAKQLHGVSVDGMRAMLREAGVDFDAYPVFFKRGTYLRRVSGERELTEEERAAIPEKFRPEPGAKLMRSDVACLEMPPFVTVKNRVAVVFDAANPETEEATVGVVQ